MDPVERRYLDGLAAGRRVRLAHGLPVRALATAAPPPATFEEGVKRELHPSDAFPRLLACAEGNLPPSPADRFRFQWFGLTYLAPAKDGFRLRLRVPGGELRTPQVRAAADLARECASGCMQINALAGLDLETVALPDVPEALRRAEAAGLSFRDAAGDQVVAVLGHPASGLDPAEGIDVNPLVTRLEQCLLAEREFTDLPGPCVIVLDGSENARAHGLPRGDIRLVAHRGGEIGFRLEVASLGDLGTSVRPDQAVCACLELLRLYRREADRSDRVRASLAAFYGGWNKERCLGALETLLGEELPRQPPAATTPPQARADAWPGPSAVAATPSGPWLSGQWEHVAHLADALGSGRLRPMAGGGLLFPGVPPAHARALREELQRLGAAVQPPPAVVARP